MSKPQPKSATSKPATAPKVAQRTVTPANKTATQNKSSAPSRPSTASRNAAQKSAIAPKQASQAPKRPAQTQAPKKIPAKPAAPQEPKADNWINRTVQGGVAYVGNYAGGLVNSVGDRVNSFGEGVGSRINETTRGWGQGISGYGNDIKDSVGVGGPRVATAGNPLGLSGMGGAKGQAPSGNKKPAQGTAQKTGKVSGSNPLGLA